MPGAGGLALLLVVFLLVITQGAEWGYASPAVVSLVVLVVGGCVLWAWWQLHAPDPLVDLRLAALPTVGWTNLTALLFGFTMYTQGLAFPQFMNAPTDTGYGHGLSMVEAGLLMAPGGIVMMLLASPSARLTLSRGAQVTLVVAGSLVSSSYLMPLVWDQEPWQLMIASMVMCAGLAFGYGAMPMLIISAVPVSETAAAIGLNALVRSLGLAVSGAVVTAILASSTLTSGGATFPTLIGFRSAFAITAIVALLAVLSATRVPTVRQRAPGV